MVACPHRAQDSSIEGFLTTVTALSVEMGAKNGIGCLASRLGRSRLRVAQRTSAAQRWASATWSRRAGFTCQRPAAVGQPRASDTCASRTCSVSRWSSFV